MDFEIRRLTTRVNVDDTHAQFRVHLETDDCPPRGPEGTARFFHILRTMVDNPAMTQCGPSWPDTVTVRHDGTRWVADLQADVQVPPGG